MHLLDKLLGKKTAPEEDSDSWLEEYRELLFGEGHNDDTIMQSTRLKVSHMPDHLYKYRCFTPNHLKALEAGQLYAASITSLNDMKEANLVPTEAFRKDLCQKTYNIIRERTGNVLPEAHVETQQEIDDAITAHFRKVSGGKRGSGNFVVKFIELSRTVADKLREEALEKYLERLRTTYSICSLSARNDISKMWERYSEDHEGFCIEYDFKSFGLGNPVCDLICPVLYVEDNTIFINSLDEVDPVFVMMASSMKDRETWAYEKEWRRFYKREEAGKPQDMPKPTAIYLGEKASTDNTNWMKDFCSRNSIPLYRMKYNKKKDRFIPEKVS